MLLKFLPIAPLAVTPELFGKYLKSKVLVNEHLSEIARRWAEKFGDGWIASDLPEQLLGLSAEYRLGVAIFFLDFLDKIRIPALSSTLQMAVEWGQSDPGIALALLRRAPVLQQSRYSDLPAKILALIPTLAASPLESTKIELISVLAEVPILLTGNENVLYRVFSALGGDRAVAVRIAFLGKIQDLYKKVPTPNLRNGILQVYQGLFGDKEMTVLERLVDPFMLVRFAEMRSPPTMSVVLDVAEKFKARWRFFSKLLATLELFPMDCLTSMLSRFLGMVEEAVAMNPQSLGRFAVSFYRFLIHSRLECLKLPDFLTYVHASYGRSKHFQQRIVYIRFAGALLAEFTREEFLSSIWPNVLGYGEERVSAVRVKVLEFVVTLARQFHSQQSPGLSLEIEELTRKYESDNDPQVVTLLRQARTFIGPRKARTLVLTDGRTGLPAIAHGPGSTRASPRVESVPPPRASQNEGRGSTRRGIGASMQRHPSPSMPRHRPVYGGVAKSGSSGAVYSLLAPGRPK
jgi:hypothetical protein